MWRSIAWSTLICRSQESTQSSLLKSTSTTQPDSFRYRGANTCQTSPGLRSGLQKMFSKIDLHTLHKANHWRLTALIRHWQHYQSNMGYLEQNHSATGVNRSSHMKENQLSAISVVKSFISWTVFKITFCCNTMAKLAAKQSPDIIHLLHLLCHHQLLQLLPIHAIKP